MYVIPTTHFVSFSFIKRRYRKEENAESFKFMCVSDQQKGEPHDLPDYSYFTNVLKTVLKIGFISIHFYTEKATDNNHNNHCRSL